MLNDNPFVDYNIKFLLLEAKHPEFEPIEEGPIFIMRQVNDILKMEKLVYKLVNKELVIHDK